MQTIFFIKVERISGRLLWHYTEAIDLNFQRTRIGATNFRTSECWYWRFESKYRISQVSGQFDSGKTVVSSIHLQIWNNINIKSLRFNGSGERYEALIKPIERNFCSSLRAHQRYHCKALPHSKEWMVHRNSKYIGTIDQRNDFRQHIRGKHIV